MKKYLPFVVLLLGLLYLGSTLLPPRRQSDFDLRGFGRLPVLVNGRIKPLDTVARNSLLVFQGRQDFTAPDGQHLQPIEWLLDVLFNPAVADSYQHFVIHNPDVLALFGKQPGTQEYFSFNDLRSGLTELQRQERMAEAVDDGARTPFQREVVDLYQRLVLYQHLKASLNLEDSPDFLDVLVRFQQSLPALSTAFLAKEAGKPYNAQDYKTLTDFVSRFQYLSDYGYLLAIPPPAGSTDPNAWRKAGDALLATFREGAVDPDVMAYGALGHAWRLKQPKDFNEIVRLYTAQLAKRFAPELKRCRIEAVFNQAQPFYSGMILYVLTLLLALISWLKWPDVLQASAFWLMALAFAASTAGIATRMWLEGRPPVTNLYSSALFVGWVAVALCLILERIYKNAIAAVAGSMIGFGTLLIAHHLSLSGDTMEMMRAVLDSNYWLATHVVVVTMGYGSTYLAGFLAIIYIVRGLFTTSLTKETADSLTRMVYGIVCFATLFSFSGTVLGGIWADQSWGRFWGWDPKENGALIIVLWNAIILHCRWAGMIRQRGLMMLAVFGNVVTSWSYFGTNLLGVGLHSYGFTQGTFTWLVGFAVSQVLIIALAAIPLDKWRSFRAAARPPGPKPGLAAP
jgi:ABC-type transport system involved in cytochrome c biogenesis permease subunit